jgi:perosamine synthetase
VKIRRTLPPVGYRIGLDLLASGVPAAFVASGRHAATLQENMASRFGVTTALTFSSGKAALTIALMALRRLSSRTKVIVPAYTCYSVPSAVVRAGLQVVPCDIRSGSFDYDYAQLADLLQSDVLAVLSVHLFGIPSNTRRLKEMCRRRGIFVVEDAAQALGGSSDGATLGTTGDVGIFSLGRGKNINAGGGGILLTDSPAIADALAIPTAGIRAPARTTDVATLGSLLLLAVFITPSLYWFPAGLSFLRLGETIFDDRFSILQLSDFHARLMRGWEVRLGALNDMRRRNAQYYRAHIEAGQNLDPSIPYLRFPVMLPTKAERQRVLREGSAAGISGMYPATIAEIPQLRLSLRETSFPEAEDVAGRLVTLPTHPLVTETDRVRVCALINNAMRAGNAPHARSA